MVLSKGARVKVVRGRKSEGVTGTIFWVGDNKYGEGKRYGIHGDDGATHWVAAEYCDPWDAPPEPVETPDLVRGDQVSWEVDGVRVYGEVFWVGASKHGPGTRIGVKTPDDETLWFDARQVDKVEGEAAAPRGRPQVTAPARASEPPPDDLPPFAPADGGIPAGMPDDEPPPWEPDEIEGGGEPPPLSDLDWD
jgi:hypothetical protein